MSVLYPRVWSALLWGGVRWWLVGLLLCIYVPTWSEAQEGGSYRGQVLDREQGTPLEGVICQLLDAEDRPIAYTFTDANGYFLLSPSSGSVPALHLSFRLLGYRHQRMACAELSTSQPLRVELSISTQTIPGITVAAHPIVQRGDTVAYTAASFKGQEDRYVADLLRKLPGIEVSKEGTISYMGEAISHFYVEGRDLMGSSYAMISNNMDADAVRSVEVLERHSRIKALKGAHSSSRAAINIRLHDRYRLRPFGEGEGGLGTTADHPPLWLARGSTTLVSPALQIFGWATTTNSGTELVAADQMDRIDLSSGAPFEPPTPRLLSIPSARTAPVSTARQLFNSIAQATGNGLLALNPDTELRLNAYYGRERRRSVYSIHEELYRSGDPIVLDEQTSATSIRFHAAVKAAYELNSDRSYVWNQLSWVNHHHSGRADIAGAHPLLTHTKIGSMIWQDELSSVIRLPSDHVVRLGALVRYTHLREELSARDSEGYLGVHPSPADAPLPTTPISSSLDTRHMVVLLRGSTSLRIGARPLRLGADLRYAQLTQRGTPLASVDGMSATASAKEHAQSYAFGAAPQGIAYAQSHFRDLDLGLTPSYGIQLGSDDSYLSFALPLLWSYRAFRHSSVAEERGAEALMLASPYVQCSWQSGLYWESSLRITYEMSRDDRANLMGFTMRSGYRSAEQPSGYFQHAHSVVLMERLSYKNLGKLLFGYLSILYRYTEQDYLQSYVYTPYMTLSGSVRRPGVQRHMLKVVGEVTKNYSSPRVSVTLRPQFTRLLLNSIQQGRDVRNYAHSLSLTGEGEWAPSDQMTLKLGAEARGAWNVNPIHPTTLYSDYSSQAELLYFPTKRLSITLRGEHRTLQRSKGGYEHNLFADASARYTWKSMEVSLEAKNIANNQVYRTIEESTLNRFEALFPLRGREVVVSFKCKF